MKLIDVAKTCLPPDMHLVKDYHYFDIYDFLFKHRHDSVQSVLEIGVDRGGSLHMWHAYFPNSRVVGIDIDRKAKLAECKEKEIYVEIGNQEDISFLEHVAMEHGPFDLIVDDGSHQYRAQKWSLATLFYHVKDGGFYVIEDVGTSYWESFGGGRGHHDSFIEYAKDLVDSVNFGAYTSALAGKNQETRNTGSVFEDTLGSIHFFSSMVVLQKYGVGFSKQVCNTLSV